MADLEEDTSLPSIRRSQRTMRRRPSRYGDNDLDDEGSDTDNADADLSDSANVGEDESFTVDLDRDEEANDRNDEAVLERLENIETNLSEEHSSNERNEVEIHLPQYVDNPNQILGTKWGTLEGIELASYIDKVYLEVTRWRRNIFYLPTCKAGEEFIEELTRIFNLFSSGSAFEPIAFTMAAIIFPLVLQKPAKDSRTTDHKRYLEKRLKLWKRGDLEELINEGCDIQKRTLGRRKTVLKRREKVY